MKSKRQIFVSAMLDCRIVLINAFILIIGLTPSSSYGMTDKATRAALANASTHSVFGKSHQLKADIVVTGYVYDETNLPMPGAVVLEKGTNNATSTNTLGFFALVLKGSSPVLQVRSTGSTTQEINVGVQRTFKITLVSSQTSLSEVVIVGYGTAKKVTNLGAQASIGTKDLVQSPVANISNSLAGRLPGLFAVQSSGEPGADNSNIFIRGVSTFSGSQGPLVLVDGIQVDNYNSIDPNEIENVSILKDASSTAVYGIRGANGVILITTKRGKIGAPTVSYTVNNSFNSFTDTPEKMGSYDYASAFNQALKNDAYVLGSPYTPRYSDADLNKYRSGEDPVFYPNINWYDLMVKDVSRQTQHNISTRGGTEKVKYSLSAGLFNQEGLFKDAGVISDYDPQIRYKRYNFRSNLDYNITSRLKATFDIASMIENRSGNNADTRSIMNFLAGANPLLAPGVVDGKIVVFPGASSPLTTLYSVGYKNDVRSLLNGTFRLDHNLDFITKGLTTHGTVAYQNLNRKLSTYNRNFLTYQALRNPDNSVTLLRRTDEVPFVYTPSDTERNRRITAELALDYKRMFGGHTVTGLLLYNQIKTYNKDFAFLVPNSYQSYVGRVVYDFKSKYLAEFSAAYNGTENFAPSNRFGFFPAYSLGWVPTNEAFFPKTDILNSLKIRGSYGEVGNDQLSNNFLNDPNSRFLYRSPAYTTTGPYTGSSAYRFGTFGANLASYQGLREGSASSPDLTWERAIKTNLGVDITAFSNKVTFTGDLFRETRDNILAVPRTISAIIGVIPAAQNIGKMSNKGFELDLSFRDWLGELSYWLKSNYSFSRNKVIYQDEIPFTFPYRNRTGNIFGQNFGYIAEGFFNTWEEVNDPNRPQYVNREGNKIQPGDVRYRDLNGDGLINDDDTVPIGYSSVVPEIIYGFSLGGSWKGLDFSVLFQGGDHFSVPYTRRANQAFFDGDPSSAPSYLSESWTQERYDQGLPINFPRFGVGNGARGFNNYLASTLWTANARYLRLKNVELGYTLKAKLLSRVGMKSARVFANANNLITWSNMLKGVDPESANLTSINGNFENYGLVRTVNLGLNVNF